MGATKIIRISRKMIVTLIIANFIGTIFAYEGSGEAEEGSGAVSFGPGRYCRVCRSLSAEECADSDEFELCKIDRFSQRENMCYLRYDMTRSFGIRYTSGCATKSECTSNMMQNFNGPIKSRYNCIPRQYIHNLRPNAECNMCHVMSDVALKDSLTALFPGGDPTRLMTMHGDFSMEDLITDPEKFLQVSHPEN